MLILAAAAFPVCASAETTGALSGQILDQRTLVPVANVTVYAVSGSATAQTRSDAHGYYLFLSLSPQRYTITFEAPGYEAMSVSGVPVSAGFSQKLTCRLFRRIMEISEGHGPYSRALLVRPNRSANVYVYSMTDVELLQRPGTASFFFRFVPGITGAAGGGIRL